MSPDIAKPLIYKDFTDKSLFLKDLAGIMPKSLIPKDRIQRGPKAHRDLSLLVKRYPIEDL